ncbi:MAG: sialidase family protein [bacterium]
MRRSRFSAVCLTTLSVGVLTAGLTHPASATTVVGSDVAVTVDSPYVKANGRTPSPGDAITACGQNRRQQNEPSAAMDPRHTSIVVAGSNDYCTVQLAGGTWTGFYRSTTSGAAWVDSLLPGYPTDNSPEGLASPLRQRGINNAGDPVQAWDLQGRLYYMGNAFNRVAPQNGSVWIATYDQDAARYRRTVIVGSGTPALNGQFNDKTAIEVDRGVHSPYQGNVYGAWSLFQGIGGNNSIQFTRSTDHGATFSHSAKISTGSKNVQFADIAVTSNGTVYVAYRQFETIRGHQRDEVAYVVSHDGGRTFSKPSTAAPFESYDAADFAGNPAAAAEAHDQAYENADGPESEAGAESVGNSRDCGSGPFTCQSGFVFFRHDSQPRITADPKASNQRVYLTYDATIPGTEQPSKTTYNTAEPAGSTLRVGQGGIYFASLSGTGGSWSKPRLLAPTARGHQFFPDINADGGVLHAVWHDSRNDPAYSVQYPPGNNGAVRDAAGFATPTRGLDTYGASSTNAGTTWSVARLSTVSQMPNYEMFGDRRVPFHGDYNYVTSVGHVAYSVWTDTRQVVPGDDPRYVGGEGFDVHQCRTKDATGTWGPDTCPNAGGVDQDIFGRASTG